MRDLCWTRILCIGISSLLAVGAIVSVALSGQPDSSTTLQTIVKGLDHRAGLLHTFEGYVTEVSFAGPASLMERPRNVAKTCFHVVDRDYDQWLYEWCRYFPSGANPDRFIRHQVHVSTHGLWAEKKIESLTWMLSTEEQGRDFRTDLTWDCFFLGLREMRGGSWDDRAKGVPEMTVTKEQLDGTMCYRIAGQHRQATSDIRTYGFIWIDPDRGFAIRKWSMFAWRDGRVIMDDTGRAYDFREYSGGLWLPQRTRMVSCVSKGGRPRTWSEVSFYQLSDAKVNQPLSEDFFGPLEFTDAHPRNRYDAKLGGYDPKEVKRKKALLERLAAGPPDPATFVEPLPELPRP